MNEKLLDLPIYESSIDEFIGYENYKNLVESLNKLDSFLASSNYYNEGVNDSKYKKKWVQRPISNTKSDLKNVAGIYDTITDVEAMKLRVNSNALEFGIGAIWKVTEFVTKIILTIPDMIIDTATKLTKIPPEVFHKIKGDLNLYITVQDLQALYNKNLLLYLDNSIDLLVLISQGDTWKTFFGPLNIARRVLNVGIAGMKGESDKALIKKLHSQYSHIKGLHFEPTTIDMSIPENRTIYLGVNYKINFKDLKGKLHSASYFDSLKHLSWDLAEERNTLSELQEVFSNKLSRTRLNQNFVKQPKDVQDSITQVITETSKVISIIGNITKYIIKDMKTIQDAANKMRKKTI